MFCEITLIDITFCEIFKGNAFHRDGSFYLQIDCLQYRLPISLLLTVSLHIKIIGYSSIALFRRNKIFINGVIFAYMYYCLQLNCLHVLFSALKTNSVLKNTNSVLKNTNFLL